MSKHKKETSSALQPIRTETVLSKLPIHNLSKSKKINIQITKKNETGKVELHWKVAYNSEYGIPGELAYKIDTLIINKRIDEVGRPIPEMLRIGGQNEICLELGVSQNSKNTTNVKKAMRQNAATFISAQLDYKGKDGTKRRLEADFTRYGVIFTGERFPDGKKADAIYLFPNAIYREVLNNAPVRPLDYNYLKQLTPSAQRFYEILSYRLFPVMKYKLKQVKLLYSEYCTYSAQQRYYDYDHFKKQMYKIHKPHLTSGYIEKVEYQATQDDEGKQDWLMCYIPGPKAVAEYNVFNGKQIVEEPHATITIESSKPKQLPAKKGSQSNGESVQPLLEPKQNTVSKVAETNKKLALELVQYFHKLARQQDNYQPHAGSKELSQAQTILNNYGWEKAKYIIEFAIAEAKKTNFSMRTIGAVLQYVNDAIAQCEQREAQTQRVQAQKEKQDEEIDALLASIPADQYQVLYEQAKSQVLSDVPALASCEEASIQGLIKTEMVRALARQERKKNS